MTEKVNLVKNEEISLERFANGKLQKLTCTIGWKISDSDDNWEMEQTFIIIDKSGNYVKEVSTIFQDCSDEFSWRRNDRTAERSTDLDNVQKIDINFHKLNPDYERIIVVMNIDEALTKGQNLSRVKEIYVQLDAKVKKDLVEYRMKNFNEFERENAMIIGEFYKKGEEWRFQTVGEPLHIVQIVDITYRVERKYKDSFCKEKSWKEFLQLPDYYYDPEFYITQYYLQRNIFFLIKEIFRKLFSRWKRHTKKNN